MLRYGVFDDWQANQEKAELKTGLQKSAAAYMAKGFPKKPSGWENRLTLRRRTEKAICAG